MLDPIEMSSAISQAMSSGLLKSNHFIPKSLQNKKFMVDLNEDDLPSENPKLFKVGNIHILSL